MLPLRVATPDPCDQFRDVLGALLRIPAMFGLLFYAQQKRHEYYVAWGLNPVTDTLDAMVPLALKDRKTGGRPWEHSQSTATGRSDLWTGCRLL